MPMDFPSSPTAGQVFGAYTWDGEKWVLGSATIVGSDGLIPQRSGGLTPHEKLINKMASASTITSSADVLHLFDSNGASKRFTGYNATLNIATTGVNGRDTGSEAASTWVYIWAIGKLDGTVSGLLSASLTAPVLPSGYTYKGLIGAVYNDGSSDFVPFWQNGDTVTQFERLALNGASSFVYTPISLSAFVPPNARAALLGAGLFAAGGDLISGATAIVGGSVVGGTNPTYGRNRFGGSVPASITSGNGFYAIPGAVILTTPQQTEYYTYDGGLGFAKLYLYVNGWVF